MAPKPRRAVVMVLQSFHPVIGGAERQALQLSQRLAGRGIAVKVLTRRLPRLPATELVGGVPVIRLPAPGRTGTLAFAAALFARLLLREPDAAVIHVHLAASHAIAAAAAARLRRIPVVVKIGGAAGVGEIGAARRSIGGRLKLAALRLLRPQVVALNDDHLAELRDLGLGALPVAVIPNGVDTQLHRPGTGAERQVLRRLHGLDGFVVLFAGRLADDKGQLAALRSFLDAWSRFREERPDATLLLAGDGPESAAFGAEIDSRGLGAWVRLLGRRHDLPELLRAADAFVLFSQGEGMSNALLEAMASGLPVLAPRVSGVMGMVEHGVHGLLFSPTDAEEARSALARLASNPAEALRFGEQARRLAEGFALEATADRWIELYGRLGAPLAK